MRLAILLLSWAAAGCASPGRGAAGRYARPDLDRLLAATDPRATGEADFAADVVRETRKHAAARALWAAVAAAESVGLVELYGHEDFGLGDPSYRALVFLRMSDGRCVALFADADYHDAFREDAETVPCLPVSPATMARLRARIAPAIPPRTRPFDERASGPTVTFLHLFVDGRSHAAALPTSAARMSDDREDLAAFQASYAGLAVVEALWAAAPLAFFPARDSGPDETYGPAPGFAPGGK
mgnify:CR=1 FL=1